MFFLVEVEFNSIIGEFCWQSKLVEKCFAIIISPATCNTKSRQWNATKVRVRSIVLKSSFNWFALCLRDWCELMRTVFKLTNLKYITTIYIHIIMIYLVVWYNGLYILDWIVEQLVYTCTPCKRKQKMAMQFCHTFLATVIWLGLKPHFARHWVGKMDENGHPLLICSSLSEAQI